MPQRNREDINLHINGLFEIHVWENPCLPFICHTALSASSLGYGNWHDSLELLQVTEGEGYILCDSRRYALKAGDIVVINSEEVHRIATDSRMIYHCFIIGTAFCLENGMEITNLKIKTKIESERAWELISEIVSEWNEKKPYSVTAVRSCALELLVLLGRSFSCENETKKNGSQSDAIRGGLEFINKNFFRELSLEEIAQHAGISKYHFLREFKRYTGHTVFKYINILRCECAKRLLKNSDLSVSDIAIRCGYENLSYFSKTFKTYTGIHPSKFRPGETDSFVEN